MKRNKPCTECRQLRRKCTFSPDSFDCLRCTKLNKVCIQVSKSTLEEHDLDDDNVEVEQLKSTVETLEWTIAQLQIEMNLLRSHTIHNNNNDNKALTRRINKHINHDTQVILEAMFRALQFQWKVKIKNGTFQIDTGIRSIHDLLQYYQVDSIQYLSPISNMSSFGYNNAELYRGQSDAVIRFGQQMKGGGNLLPFTVKLLTICANRKEKIPETIDLPSKLLLESHMVIDELVHLYFTCHNAYAPMVHQKMFMYNYSQLEDPFSDPLTLSICSYVCSTPCDHLYYTSRERRMMSDYFFLKAKKIILDQFDEPDKRLENVICINILTKYMQVTMKFRECSKLIMMAYQICLDLKDKYPLMVSGDFLNGIDKQDDKSEYEFGSDAYKEYLDHVLYSRHVANTLCVRRLMDFISNKAVDDSCFYFPRWLAMDDEPEQTRRFVYSQNWVLSMFNDSYIGNFLNQILKIHLGTECTLTFESIIRLEDIIDDWFKSIPPEFCISKDLKNEVECRKAIDRCSDCTILVTFIHFHLFIVGIYSSLLQPIALGENNDLLLPTVQKTSLEHALKGCRLLLYTVLRLFQLEGASKCQFTLAACEFLFHTIDALLILSLSRNEYIAFESKNILRKCLEELNNVEFIQEHRVSVFTSPIHLGLIDLNDPESFHLEYYDQCPHPWFAMVYDASHFVAFSSEQDNFIF